VWMGVSGRGCVGIERVSTAAAPRQHLLLLSQQCAHATEGAQQLQSPGASLRE
jgi:hypothetical protein